MEPRLDIGPDKFPLVWAMFCESVRALLFEEMIETFYIRMLGTFITDSGWHSGGNEWHANKITNETDTSLRNMICSISPILFFILLLTIEKGNEELVPQILWRQMMSPMQNGSTHSDYYGELYVQLKEVDSLSPITVRVQACVCWILILMWTLTYDRWPLCLSQRNPSSSYLEKQVM